MNPIRATLHLNNQDYNLYIINDSYHILDSCNNPVDLSTPLGLELLDICNKHEATIKAE